MSTSVLPNEFPALLGTVAALAVVVGCVGVVVLGHYTKRITAIGTIVPQSGTVRVHSRAPAAVIAKVFVQQGSQVRRGDPLFLLSDERVASSVVDDDSVSISGRVGSDDLLANLKRRSTRLTSSARLQSQFSERSFLEAVAQQHQAQDELAQIDREIELQTRRVLLSEDQLRRHDALATQGYVTEGFLTSAKSDLLDQQGRLEQLRRTKISLAREVSRLADVQLQLRMSREREQQQLQQAADELDHQRIERQIERTILVVAPEDGVVTNVLAEEGQLSGARTLATVIPASSTIEGEINIPSREAGQITPGQFVRLRYAAFPFQRYGQYTGKVRLVGQSGINAAERGEDAELSGSATDAEKFYRIRISLDRSAVKLPGVATSRQLSPGDRFEADISVERLSVLDWILQPFRGVKTRLSADAPPDSITKAAGAR